MKYKELDNEEKAVWHLIEAARCLSRAGGHGKSLRMIHDVFDHILNEL